MQHTGFEVPSLCLALLPGWTLRVAMNETPYTDWATDTGLQCQPPAVSALQIELPTQEFGASHLLSRHCRLSNRHRTSVPTTCPSSQSIRTNRHRTSAVSEQIEPSECLYTMKVLSVCTHDSSIHCSTRGDTEHGSSTQHSEHGRYGSPTR